MKYDRGHETEVQELMSKAVVTVRSDETVHDVLTQFQNEKISAVPVIDPQGKFVGIVSHADLVRIVLETDAALDSHYPHYDDCLWAIDMVQRRLGSEHIYNVMTELMETIGPDDSMGKAASLMLHNRVHHLPVVQSDGKLVGMLSSTDFVELTAGMRPDKSAHATQS
ncbi:MAG: CBS domain-containing protein [Pirellulaceae bacterium]|nr:CBS domain-containing protein [Pirellulaceae bacterium]